MPALQRNIVIGAGIGGLAAAALLARRGPTLVLERRSVPGGKVRTRAAGSRDIDIGPTVFTMKWVFDALFEGAGGRLAETLSLAPLETLARHGWRDGARFDLYADRRRAVDAVGKFAGPREAQGFERFLRDAARIYETLRDPFLRADRPSMTGLMTGAGPLRLLGIDAFSTMWSSLGRYFEDQRLRQLFGRYATYCGSSPFSAPATLMLIAHVEQEGVWAIDGGMMALARALEELARANGAEFRYGADVREILVERGAVCGVVLADGERLAGRTVVCNGDVAALAGGHFGGAVARAAAAPGVRSQSAMTWSFEGRATGFDLALHTVFFSDDYAAEFDDVFVRGRVPAAPTVYAYAPDRVGAAPRGDLERFFCLINAPADGDRRAYPQEETDLCRRRVFDHLKACGLSIETDAASAMTPADFARDYPGTGGAIYGRASHGWKASFERPGVGTRIPGLFLAGGSVHPGPGAPMAALSGMAAARAATAYAST